MLVILAHSYSCNSKAVFKGPARRLHNLSTLVHIYLMREEISLRLSCCLVFLTKP